MGTKRYSAIQQSTYNMNTILEKWRIINNENKVTRPKATESSSMRLT